MSHIIASPSAGAHHLFPSWIMGETAHAQNGIILLAKDNMRLISFSEISLFHE